MVVFQVPGQLAGTEGEEQTPQGCGQEYQASCQGIGLPTGLHVERNQVENTGLDQGHDQYGNHPKGEGTAFKDVHIHE